MTVDPFTVVWLQAGSCGGCTMAALDAEGVGLVEALRPHGVEVLWHPALSAACGAETLNILNDILDGKTRLDVLCVEGSAMTGPNGSGGFHMFAGTGRPMAHWIADLAEQAGHVVAVGSCAAYGGIPAGMPNPTDATGLQWDGVEAGGLLGEGFRSRAGVPVINVAGCAPHPGWIAETLMALAAGDLRSEDLDMHARPRFFADHLAHHGCSRNEFYEFKASAQHFSQRGCLMEHLGCKATQAPGDCNQRVWNGTSGACPDAGFTCIACTVPGFEEPGASFLKTPKVAGIPVGLPLDMPKAWFIALAALSKSATPARVRTNAEADHVRIPPARKDRDK
ncbi:HupU protein [Magnetospira thiophila]